MNPGVLVDSTVWSLALRRPTSSIHRETGEFGALSREGRVRIIGPVRQEVLSGIRSAEHFLVVRERLRSFPDLVLETRDFERAAEMFNRCRARGVQGSHTDFLICAVAERHDLAVFTTDVDFRRYGRVIPLRPHAVRPQA